MADRHRLGTFSAGGQFTTVLDLNPGTGTYAPVRDTFSVSPPAQTDVKAKNSRRYGGSKRVAEIHDNGQISVELYINGGSMDGSLALFDAITAISESALTQYYYEYRPDGASRSTYFEIRTASWEPMFRWIEHQATKTLHAKFGFEVAPLALGDPLDIYDDFSQSQASIAFTNLLTNGSVETDLSGYVLTSQPYPAAVLADSPAAYLRLGESSGTVAADSAGANTGTYTASATLGAAGPTSDGTTGITASGSTTAPVTVADANSLDLGDTLTMECWFKATSVSGTQGLISKGSGSYYLRLNGGNLQFLQDRTASIVTSTVAVTAGGWHHVVVTKNGATVKMYLDGADVTGAVTNATLTDTAFQLLIGSDHLSASNSPTEFFTGQIAEVAVYPTALSSARVTAHYTAATATVAHTGSGGETTFTVGAATLAQSAAWAAAGTKSARLTVAGATASHTTVDSPSFAVTGLASYSARIAYNAATISAGNIALQIHWSDGSTSPLATVTAPGSGLATGTATAPAGATTATIRAAPSTAGTFDISLDAAMPVTGSTVPPSYADTNLYTGGLLTDYTWDTGTDTLIDYTGALVPTDTTEKRLIHTARGYTFTDVQASVKVTPGASVAATHSEGLILRRVDASNFLWASVDDTNALRIFKRVAGSDTQLATAAFTPVANTTYWLRFRTESNVLFAEAWNTEPTAAGTPATSVSYTLSTAEQATFGAGVAGFAGLRLIPKAPDYRYDDFRVEPYTYRLKNLPDTIDLRNIPGTAPARVDATFGVNNPGSIQAWAMLGWARKPSIFNAVWNGDFEDAALGTTGWVVTTDAGYILNAGGTVSRVTTSAKFGSASMQLAATAQWSGTKFPIYRVFRKGVTYTVSFWAQTVSGAAGNWLVQLGNLAATDSANSTVTPVAGWSQFTFQWTPTADQQGAYLAFERSVATASTINIDGVQVYEGTVAPTVGKHSEGKGAVPPFGIIQAESAIPSTLSSYAITANAGAVGGYDIENASSSAASAEWFVDPSLLVADDFTGEISIEVYGRAVVHASATASTAILSAVPENNAGQRIYTSEWGAAGRPLVLPSSAAAWRLTRLGTLTLPVDSLFPSRWRFKLAWTNGVSVITQFDYLLMVPARQRAAGATGKGNDATYPSFLHASTTEEAKTIRTDLSGRYGVPPNVFGRDSGLSGQALEFPAGVDVQTAVKLSNTVPDDPALSTTGELSSTNGLTPTSVHYAVWPRYILTRSA